MNIFFQTPRRIPAQKAHREHVFVEEFGAQDMHSKTLKRDDFNALNDNSELENLLLWPATLIEPILR